MLRQLSPQEAQREPADDYRCLGRVEAHLVFVSRFVADGPSLSNSTPRMVARGEAFHEVGVA
jgi:hypothetical protein